MSFIQILKNYLFSRNWSATNPSYRFSPIFYKRFTVDFLLRIFIFLPFTISLASLVQNGYFKEIADTMLQSNQNVYGYLLVIFVYVPILLFFVCSFIYSIIGSILKRTIFTSQDLEGEVSILPTTFGGAFLASWKNLWFLTIETFILLFVCKIIIELVAIQTVTFAFMPLVKASLITVATSAILALIVSLPWLHSKNKVDKVDSNDTVIAH